MSIDDRTWSEWFRWHLDQAPFQILHMRELVETTVRAQDTEAVRVSGGSDPARLPYNADPADDADALYVELVLFAREVSEHTGILAPAPVRNGLWQGAREPQGLPVCRPDQAFTWAGEIRTWLINQTTDLEQLAHDGKLGDAPNHLVGTIREMRKRYPRAEPKFRAYRPRPCPTCGQRTVSPIWGVNGLTGAKCDTCGQEWSNGRTYSSA
jgi:hypothetical protein